MALAEEVLMDLFKRGKARTPHRKNTAEMPAVRIPTPSSVLISTSQHIGAPSVPVVKAGDKVYVGTLIAEAGGYVGSPIHSSVSGVVRGLEEFLTSSGKVLSAIRIDSDGEMTPDPAIAPPVITDFDSFSAAVRASGLVGLGGAGFPTSVKLDAQKRGLIKKIVINGAECEPYITSDTRTMLDDAEWVVKGIEYLLKFISAEEVIIGIEENKPECISRLSALLIDEPRAKVLEMPSEYPQGAEKILIYNTTGIVVPEGKLPANVGCLVLNVTSVAFIAKYMETGMPLVEKCVTVDGSAVTTPMNVIAPIGTAIGELINFAGGYKGEVGKVLYGGPMMGIAIYSTDDPIFKNTNAILALSPAESRKPKPTACIHCGRCVATCPMSLNPTVYAKALKLDDPVEKVARLEAAKINLCIECGSCSYVCPANRPLVENNKLSKAAVRAAQAEKK